MSAPYTKGGTALLLVSFSVYLTFRRSVVVPPHVQCEHGADAGSDLQSWVSGCNASTEPSLYHVLFLQSTLQMEGTQGTLVPTKIGFSTAAEPIKVHNASNAFKMVMPHDQSSFLVTASSRRDALRTTWWGAELDSPFQALFVQPLAFKFSYPGAPFWMASPGQHLLHKVAPSMIASGSSGRMLAVNLGPKDWIFWFLVAYIIIWAIILTNLLLVAFWPPKSGVKLQYSSRRPEQEAWNKGFISWMMMGWAGNYVGEFGYPSDPSKTKVQASQLGRIGWVDDEAYYGGKRWEKLWREDVNTYGTDRLVAPWVGLKFCTMRKLFSLEACMAGHQLLMYLGLTHSVWWLLDRLQTLEMTRQLHGFDSIVMSDLIVPSVVVIVLFTVLPLWMIMFESIMTLLNFRLSNRLTGAIQVAVFRKVQRLPVNAGADFDYTPGDGTSYRYSYMQLVGTDVNQGIVQIFTSLFRVVTGLPILTILTVDMCVQMKLATLHVLASIILLFIAGRACIHFTVMTATTAQNIAGVRVSMSQEILYSIRLVKSFAWEDPFFERLDLIRKEEIKVLVGYFLWMGVCFFFMFNYSRIMIFCGVFGYMACYGFIPATKIFVFMQVLQSFNGEIKNLIDILPNIAILLPSIRRLDFFFKLPESDHYRLEDEPQKDKAQPKQDKDKSLRVKGSYTWGSGTPTVLHDIDLTIQPGEVVAIVGEVGSGKSSLCQALIGEMTSVDDDAEPYAPEKLAYHSQIPLIMEGTLRDNILYYRDYDEERYQATLDAACLRRDLEVISGADDAPIGARGIMLSGGQKARVSIARAAYSPDVEHMILDDPFGALDGPTAATVVERILLGPIMEGKTKVVVCQPDTDRLMPFDRIIVVSKGSVVEDGSPADVIQTRAYKNLLHSDEDGESTSVSSCSSRDDLQDSQAPNTQKIELREEESQGRVDMKTLKFYGDMGSWFMLIWCLGWFTLMVVFQLFADLQLTAWSNDSIEREAQGKPQLVTNYFVWYAVWTLIGLCAWFICWVAGIRFSINVSKNIHEMIMTRLLRAPVDRFFDKTPVGRILNRLAGDLGQIDFTMYTKVTETYCLVIFVFVPLIYVHCVTPLWFLAISIPFYFVLFAFVYRYWNIVVPMKYLDVTTISVASTFVTEAQYSNHTVRAYGVQDKVTWKFAEAIHDCIMSHFAQTTSRQWIINRLYLMYSFFCTMLSLICLWCPSTMDIGKSSLCLLSTVQIIMTLGLQLDSFTSAQFQFVAMNRCHEYLSLPQERPAELPTDEQFDAFDGQVHRKDLGSLEFKVDDGRISILRRTGGRADLILEQVKDKQFFTPVKGKAWLELSPQLTRGRSWHCLRGVNKVEGNAQKIAEELCYGSAAQQELHFESTWRTKAAHVSVKDLSAGYGDIPENILKGLSFEVLPKTRVAIVGTTGCGKSTLLLAFLRIVEPRGGSILLNGIDNQAMGLKTLRKLLGLVPQDPVLFSGSIRANLDPFDEYTDERMWEALEHVQMEKIVRGLGPDAANGAASESSQRTSMQSLEGITQVDEAVGAGLEWKVKSDGENLSYGQRQLLCTARMILRQPSLLLLDECTSAIDPRTQELVQAALAPKTTDKNSRPAFPNSTIIAIAHRLETVLDFDKIIVMQRGRIAEMGGVKELANIPGGLFANALTPRGQLLFSRAKKEEGENQ